MAAKVRFSGVILAGGASTRMGTDKALMDVGGRKLIEIAVGALTEAGANEVFAVGGNSEGLFAIGLTCVPDQFPGEGPLGGVITALDAAAEDLVMILACDQVSTTAEAVHTVLGAVGGADLAIALVGGQLQTTHAVWRRSCRDSLRRAFNSGERSIRNGIKDLALVPILDADPQWFVDADTPDELLSRSAERPTTQQHH